MSDVWLSVESEDPVGGLEDLTSWLRHEPELRGRVKPIENAPDPNELGALTDVLAVAVGSGGAISVLAGALKAFLAQPRRSDVSVVVHTGPDGRTVTIDASRVEDVEALVRLALEGDR